MATTAPEVFHEQQTTRWNSDDGKYWVEHQERLDRILQPVLDALIPFAAPRRDSKVIDIGCGCGATTVALAKVSGEVTGVDVSAPMVAVASERLRGFANARCICADAAVFDFSGWNAELVTSRFGVMFFGDPTAAFANIRRGMAPGGRLRFACWRPLPENPWLLVPLVAACKHVPALPKPEPGEPGPFAFGDRERVTGILTGAGFSKPVFRPLDLAIDVSGGGGLDAAVHQATSMGPARRAMTDQPEDLRAAAVEAIRDALRAYERNGKVEMPGAAWLVAAENPRA